MEENSGNAIAGLKIILQPLPNSDRSVPLTNWLPPSPNIPVWVNLTKSGDIIKVMPILPTAQHYPSLLDSISHQISQNKIVQWQGKNYQINGIEIDRHSLHVLHVSLTPAKTLPSTMGRAIHARFFKWLAATNPDLAEEIHSSKSLPVTLALRANTFRQNFYLRISILQKDLLAPLLWGLSQDLGVDINLAHIDCRLGNNLEIVQSTTFEELANTPTSHLIEIEFVSPTSFKQEQNVQALPLPELVFDNLWRRWNTFAPENLHFPAIKWHCLVSAFDIKTYALKMKGGPEIGAQGWVRYLFPKPEEAAIATTLANFAVFAGIGRKTGMGMGQVKVFTESRQRD